MEALTRGVLYGDLNFLGRPRVIATAVLQAPGGVALVDPGPSTCLDELRALLANHGIGLCDVRALLLTHIHLDHAGGAGALMREFAAARLVVHRLGRRSLTAASWQ